MEEWVGVGWGGGGTVGEWEGLVLWYRETWG